MIIQPTSLDGAFTIDVYKHEDNRGFFARTFCVETFKNHHLETVFMQQNMSVSNKKHTLRGMHYQHQPHREVKLIRCLRGAILDVIIDLNPNSCSFLNHYSVELSESNNRQLYVPTGFAHGFISLTDNVEVSYLVSANYTPASEGGIRWNDPKFKIDWPTEAPIISEKDRNWPDF